MNSKYEIAHDRILMMLHDLVFGGFGLMGDAKETLLRTWYKNFAEEIEKEFEKAIRSDYPSEPIKFAK